MEAIEIRMLGEFSLRTQTHTLSDTGSRSKKVWSLLAYLICNRGRSFSQQKLIDLLWGADSNCTNPENALRITLHRMRTQLGTLWPGAGRELIIRQDGGYAWNSQVPVRLDCEEFDSLCRTAPEKTALRLESIEKALSLYRGEFLPKYASDMWIIPISTHFQNQYLQMTLEAARLLSEQNRHEEAVSLCRAAAKTEPYHEPLHQILMQQLSAIGDVKGAAAVYEALQQRLFDDFGIRPNEETTAVYRAAVHTPEDRTLPMDEVLQQLQEPKGNAGAMQCDYDYFKILCYAESRAMERNGNVTHIALLSLVSTSDRPLSKRSRERIMEHLGDTLRISLRRGDTISRCSVTQYIIMLPKANYENSCMVCRRVIASFNRLHPHTAAKVNFMVQPLTPSICVP